MLREDEELYLDACVKGPDADFWKALPPEKHYEAAGLVMFLSVLHNKTKFDWRPLVNKLCPEVATGEELQRWLGKKFIDPSRFVNMLMERLGHG